MSGNGGLDVWQQTVHGLVGAVVRTLQDKGLDPIACVVATLSATSGAHIDGMSNHDYPDAARFQSELSELLELIYGNRKDAQGAMEDRVYGKIAAALEEAQHDPERAWCKVVNGRYDIDYRACAEIACSVPR